MHCSPLGLASSSCAPALLPIADIPLHVHGSLRSSTSCLWTPCSVIILVRGCSVSRRRVRHLSGLHWEWNCWAPSSVFLIALRPLRTSWSSVCFLACRPSPPLLHQAELCWLLSTSCARWVYTCCSVCEHQSPKAS